MKKHAYLIMANENYDQLCRLLKLLDHERNHIFLHMDAKSRVTDEDTQRFHASVSASRLFIIPDPIPVYWGDDSLILCEMKLLKYATAEGEYDYYHLLSGKCLPLMDQDRMHAFFDAHRGAEFVSIESMDMKKHAFRYEVYHTFLRKFKHAKKKSVKALIFASAKLQKLVGINRTRGQDVTFKKGPNWFSITHELATYVLSKEQWIEETFKHTFCCDEVFLQTIVYNSEFRERVYQNPSAASMRYIDWQRGNPYTFRACDYDELMQCGYLFARKFDSKIDEAIIERICERVTEDSQASKA